MNSRRVRSCATFIFAYCAAIGLSPAATAQKAPNADLLEVKGVFLKHVNDDRTQIDKYEGLLARAQDAHSQAVKDSDIDGENVTAEAIGNAQQALDRARLNLADDQTRLDAVNRALQWWGDNRDTGVPRALATILRGQVTVDSPTGPVVFDPNSPVRPGERIHVGDKSFLELQLDDGSQMHLGPGTEFLYERDVQGVYWQLFRGEMHKITIIMGVRGANEPRYRGCTAIAAVRGTDFTLETNGTGDTFTVLDGAIEVDPGSGRDKVMLRGGQRLVVAKSGAVGSPVTFDAKTLSHWWAR
jgi:FecR protein